MTPRSLLAPARLGGQPILRAQTDERLVELAREGSRPAFEAIVARYRRALVSYSARFLGQERAEDAAQQSFVKAYTALTGGEVVRNLRPWLYRIAHNTSLNMLRDRALHHEPLTDEIDGVERPDQAAERHQELHHALAAVKALPPRQRDAIVLRALEGRSYEQIAESLGISRGAVRQLLSRARCSMRAGVAAVTPVGLLARIAAPFGDAPATMVAGAGSGGGGTFAVTKVCAAAVAAAVAGGGVSGLPDGRGERGPGDRDASASAQTRASTARPAAASGSQTVSLTQPGSRSPRGAPSTPRRQATRVGSSAPAAERGGREGQPDGGTNRRDRGPSAGEPRRGPSGDRREPQAAPRDPARSSLPPAPTGPGDDGLDDRLRLGAPSPGGGEVATIGVDDGRMGSRDGTSTLGAR